MPGEMNKTSLTSALRGRRAAFPWQNRASSCTSGRSPPRARSFSHAANQCTPCETYRAQLSQKRPLARGSEAFSRHCMRLGRARL